MRCKRGTFAKQRQPFVPQINVRITEEQLLWLSSQVKPFRNKSAVIRDLIDSTIQGVDVDAKLSAYHVGPGEPQGNSRPLIGTTNRLSNLSALQGKYSTSAQPTTADSVPAQKVEDEKNIYKGVKNEIKVEKPVSHALRATKARLSLRRFGSVTRPAGIVPGQSKPKALELWEQLVPDELQADDLMRAIDGATGHSLKARCWRVCIASA